MCATGAKAGPGARIDLPVSFDPEARCCTYQPAMWDFLAGAALADRSHDGAVARESILARISRGDGVTPLGLERSRRYAGLYGLGVAGFGHAHSLRCPHYIEAGARFAIWQHRESTCATWFCKHEHGGVSKRFWDRLHAVLRASELAVARHALLGLGIGADALAALLPISTSADRGLSAAELDGIADPVRQRRVWGDWIGREAEFYEAAAGLASAMPWSTIRRLGGSDLEVHVALLHEAHRDLLEGTPPERLTLRSYSVTVVAGDAGEAVVLGTYSGIDPLVAPALLLPCLPYFDRTADGRSAPCDRGRPRHPARDRPRAPTLRVRRARVRGVAERLTLVRWWSTPRGGSTRRAH